MTKMRCPTVGTFAQPAPDGFVLFRVESHGEQWVALEYLPDGRIIRALGAESEEEARRGAIDRGWRLR